MFAEAGETGTAALKKSHVNADSSPSPVPGARSSGASRWRSGLRSAGSLSLAALLGAGHLAGCDELGDRDERGFDRWDRFDGRSGRDDDGWWGGGRRGGRHRGPRDAANDAGARVDAGNDAGEATDAGAGAADAGADASVLALTDGQLLLLADTLLLAEVEQAQAAQPFLADADALAYAEQVVVERAAARSTLQALSVALGETLADSAVNDDVRAASDAALDELSGPDAGALDPADLDLAYMASRVAAHTRALELLAAMIGAADAEPLRAQLIVLQAIQTQQLERASAILAAL